MESLSPLSFLYPLNLRLKRTRTNVYQNHSVLFIFILLLYFSGHGKRSRQASGAPPWRRRGGRHRRGPSRGWRSRRERPLRRRSGGEEGKGRGGCGLPPHRAAGKGCAGVLLVWPKNKLFLSSTPVREARQIEFRTTVCWTPFAPKLGRGFPVMPTFSSIIQVGQLLPNRSAS